MDSVGSSYRVSKNIAAKMEHIASYGAEPDAMSMDLAFNCARLVRPVEVTRYLAAKLRDLNVLDDDLAVLNIR
jgi:hypothetical protein